MMDKQKTLSYVGNMQQLASIHSVTYDEGQAKGLGAYQMRNGSMQMTILRDKALDISELSYKGVNISFLSKPGLQHKGQLSSDAGAGSIMGGFLFTAGLDNICTPAVIEDRQFPLHGHLRSIPAEHLSNRAFWDGEDYVLEVSGQMREAELFGENLLLTRKITTRFPSASFTIEDEIENQGFRDEPYFILYHFNFGFPFIDETCRILVPSGQVIPRDEVSSNNALQWQSMSQPIANESEYVYTHNTGSNAAGRTLVAVYNPSRKLGVSIEYDAEVLPHFLQWKTLGSGDYALGLEPANASVFGRQYHYDNDSLPMIRSQDRITSVITVTIIEGDDEYRILKEHIENITP